jgi:hypothetical protein
MSARLRSECPNDCHHFACADCRLGKVAAGTPSLHPFTQDEGKASKLLPTVKVARQACSRSTDKRVGRAAGTCRVWQDQKAKYLI